MMPITPYLSVSCVIMESQGSVALLNRPSLQDVLGWLQDINECHYSCMQKGYLSHDALYQQLQLTGFGKYDQIHYCPVYVRHIQIRIPHLCSESEIISLLNMNTTNNARNSIPSPTCGRGPRLHGCRR